MASIGTLYLIQSTLGTGDARQVLPSASLSVVSRLGRFIVEDPRMARAFLKSAGLARPLQEVEFNVLNEHTRSHELSALIQPLLDGEDCGLLSDAGCPAVADPGADLVQLAHRHGVRVRPLVGPSSILLALMASGLGGQRFAFHGYLPVDPIRRRKALIGLERDSSRMGLTQIFIEAPYRNRQLLQGIIEACRGETLLCLATDLTLETETIEVRSVKDWKARAHAPIDRRPTVFLLRRET